MTGPALVLVVAVAENGVIGRGGGLPWRLKSDLRRFRAVTMGKPLVMGRKTFESIGRVLDGRDSIVVTRRKDFASEGALVAHGIDAALALGVERAAARSASEICVIGGAGLFAETLPLADRLYMTRVAAAPQGDVCFPPFPAGDWLETSREELPFSEGDTVRASYVTYERRR